MPIELSPKQRETARKLMSKWKETYGSIANLSPQEQREMLSIITSIAIIEAG